MDNDSIADMVAGDDGFIIEERELLSDDEKYGFMSSPNFVALESNQLLSSGVRGYKIILSRDNSFNNK